MLSWQQLNSSAKDLTTSTCGLEKHHSPANTLTQIDSIGKLSLHTEYEHVLYLRSVNSDNQAISGKFSTFRKVKSYGLKRECRNIITFVNIEEK